MASIAYEGNYKAYLLSAAPAGLDFANGGSVVTDTELTAGTRLLRLVSDGAIAVTFTTNTASQALLDTGKVRHAIGTREVTGVSIQHERDTPFGADAMWTFYAYGDERYLVVAPEGVPTADDDHLEIYQVQIGEKHPVSTARDTIQNFMVELAVQDWDLEGTFDDEIA